MKRERKIYDPLFKTKAVQLSNERDNILELIRELGIKATLLYKWRKEYEEFGEGSFPGNGKLTLMECTLLSPHPKKLRLCLNMFIMTLKTLSN